MSHPPPFTQTVLYDRGSDTEAQTQRWTLVPRLPAAGREGDRGLGLGLEGPTQVPVQASSHKSVT